jgi:hypothetical protein
VDLLGRGILARPGAGQARLLVVLRDAEVDQEDDALRQDQVAGLDIAVNNRRRAGMQVAQGVEDLQHPGRDFVDRELLTLGEQVVEVLALDKLHHKELLVAVLEDIDRGREVRVSQLAQDLRLAQEELRRQHLAVVLLERDGAVELLVERFVERAHPAARDHLPDAIAPMHQRIWR